MKKIINMKTAVILLGALLALSIAFSVFSFVVLSGKESPPMVGGTEQSEVFATVANVGDLKKAPHSAEQINVLGYYAPNDGGGGLYVYQRDGKADAENGGTVIAAEGGGTWELAETAKVSLRQFGAKGDGKADDTDAIQKWLLSAKERKTLYAPAGEYVFKTPLTGPARNYIGLQGDGSQQTVFIYKGDKKDVDLFTIGDANRKLTGWVMSGFNIKSSVKMTAGTALRVIRMAGGSRLYDLSCSHAEEPKNLWDGVWFDGCNVLTYDGFEISVKNEGIIVSGAEKDDSGSDVTLDHGSITFSKIGVHAAGGFGGLYVGQVLIYGSEDTGFLQDNARIKRGNREIILSQFCVLDACHKYNARINDPLSDSATLQIDAYFSGAGWIAPADPGDNLFIEKLPNGRISIASSQIRVAKRHGVNVADNSTMVRISAETFIVNSGQYGIYSATQSKNISFSGKMAWNAKGDSNVSFSQ